MLEPVHAETMVNSSAPDREAPSLLILGCRGIPAAHGGFETFAQRLALFLIERGWHVAVYCQRDVAEVRRRVSSEIWQGIELINVEVATTGSVATLDFDMHCVIDAARRRGTCLVLGYNGAIFLPYLRLRGRKIVTNMDGIEWKRPKWPFPVKAWFWLNEWIGAWSSQYLIADHPAIADHLATRRDRKAIATIAYGGDPIVDTDASALGQYGLEADRYLISIARIEPDNNILTLVEAFSHRRRDAKLVVLGNLVAGNRYHAAVRAAASDEVVFPGAVYDKRVQSLRAHARAYLHGHTVGGTNPSLVEALWAGNAIIAHDNAFNRHTAGAQFYFTDVDSCERAIDRCLHDDAAVKTARAAALAQAKANYDWSSILADYERICGESAAALNDLRPSKAG